MLRRFDQFQWGPLNATRLNELVDAITRLQQEVARITPTKEPGKDTILARIDDDGYPLQAGGNNVAAVAYPFTEVQLSITPDGDTSGGSQASYQNVAGGIASTAGAVLLAFEQVPTMKQGDVVIAHYAPMVVAYADGVRKTVYMAARLASGGAMRLAEVLESRGSGEYLGRFLGPGQQDEVEFLNMYEVEDHYGATDASIQCAVITPKPIDVGRIVPLNEVADTGANQAYPTGSWVTLVPVAFDAACTCGPGAQPATSVDDVGGGRDADAAIGGIMLDRSTRMT